MTIWPVKKGFLIWIPVRGADIDVSVGRFVGCDRPKCPGSESRNGHAPTGFGSMTIHSREPADGELEGF
ncbi:MAG: hypothetical protein O6951_04070 [Actinobacteria bacterium]|nr:hypothetical protein [Actinomycetota bacterium]